MSHPITFGAQVTQVVRRRPSRHCLSPENGQAEPLHARVLRRIVRQQPHRSDSEIREHLRADAVVPRIRREAQLHVGVDGIRPQILQVVGLQLLDQPDALPFVPTQGEDDSASSAAIRAMAVSSWGPQSQRHDRIHHRSALRMSANEDGRSVVDVAQDERHVLAAVEDAAIPDGAPAAVRGGMAPDDADECRSVLRRYAIRSAIETRASPYRSAKARSSGSRAMVPSSLTISHRTPAGGKPARRARSTAASV